MKKIDDTEINKAIVSYRPNLEIEVLENNSTPDLEMFSNAVISGKQPPEGNIASPISSYSKLMGNSTNY